MKDVPIYICAKDRASFLAEQVARFERDGHRNLIVLDMGSTYPPMLRLLDSLPYPVRRCGAVPNPHLYVWTNPEILKGVGHYFYTDCDVIPDAPANWDLALLSILDRYPKIQKAGLGLRLDDLPDCFHQKAEVLKWEAQFWQNELEPAVYHAEIDTTLALYRPGFRRHDVIANTDNPHSVRTGGRYVARHLPWYADSANPTEEYRYYLAHKDPLVGHWSPNETSDPDNHPKPEKAQEPV